MNFEWSPEQEELRAGVRRFLAEQGAGAKLAELGLPGLIVPEALGGAGLGMLELGVVLEEAGRALHAGPFLASALAARLLLAVATPAEQRELVPALATAERHAAVLGLAPGAVFEAHGGRVSGAERFALEAGAADALLVACGGALHLVDARAPGVRVEPAQCLDTTRRIDHVVLDVAPARRLGAGDAHAALGAAADALAVGLAADGVGAAARALERAVEYARQRVQFGRPIGSFQAVQHLLVDMLQELELARAAVAYALWAQDAAAAPECGRASAVAKAFASEALPRVAEGAIQVFGGVGFTLELDLHRHYRRLLSLSLLCGDAAHHLERIASAVCDAEEAPR